MRAVWLGLCFLQLLSYIYDHREEMLKLPGLWIKKKQKNKVSFIKQVVILILQVTPNLPTRSSLDAFARGVLVPGSIFCDNLNTKNINAQFSLRSSTVDLLITEIVMPMKGFLGNTDEHSAQQQTG